MRRYKLEDVVRMSSNVGKPLPFPGKYPTRIAYAFVFRDESRPPITYMGKPSMSAAKRWMRIWNENEQAKIRDKQPVCEVVAYAEFDRAGLIQRYLPGTTAILIAQNMTYYHPWDAHGMGLKSFAEPFYNKRVAGNTSYSPHKTLKLAQVEERRAWLEKYGFMKKPWKPKAKSGMPDVWTNPVACNCASCSRGFVSTSMQYSGVGKTYHARCPRCGWVNTVEV